MQSALQREISEETGLKVEIYNPVEEWSFYKTPDQLIQGVTFECAYIEGNVKLCSEHKRYFWAAIDSIKHLSFNRNFFRNFSRNKNCGVNDTVLFDPYQFLFVQDQNHFFQIY